MTQRLVLVGAILLALTVGLQAQSNPLLGTWELNLSKSKYNHDAVPEGETRSYTACEGGGVGTRVETVYAYSRVAVTTFCTHLDGKEYPYHSHIADRIKETGSDWRAFDAQFDFASEHELPVGHVFSGETSIPLRLERATVLGGPSARRRGAKACTRSTGAWRSAPPLSFDGRCRRRRR